jgi:flagellum-specific peptidoglycan hydrolase FlgJ
MQKRSLISKLFLYSDGSLAWTKVSACEAYIMVVLLFIDYWWFGTVNEVILNWSIKIIPVLALIRPAQKILDKSERQIMEEYSRKNLLYRMFYHYDGTFSWTKLAAFTGNLIAMRLFLDYYLLDKVDEIVLEWSVAIISVLVGLHPAQQGFTGLIKSGLSAITRRRTEPAVIDEPVTVDTLLQFTEPAPRSHYGKSGTSQPAPKPTNEPTKPKVEPKTKAEKFIAKFWDPAKHYEKTTGLSAIFTLAQGGIERGWNIQSTGFNLFGITASESYTGPKVLLRTKEQHDSPNHKYPKIHSIRWDEKKEKYIYDCERYFRVYTSYEECFADRLAILQKPHFSHAWPHRGDPYEFVRQLQAGKKVYATGSDYVSAMGGFIKQTERIIQKLGLT